MSAPSQPTGSGSGWHLAAGQTLGGRYVLKRLLGQGGMGVVWMAYDNRLREPAALKFLPTYISTDPVALENLRRETLRSRKLSHPNIIRIHDLQEDPNEPAFITMEYVDGTNLHYMAVNHPTRVLRWKYLTPLIRQLCEALEYAHSEGIVHRDIKPANLMVDSNSRLKLADFGLAQLAREASGRDTRHAYTGGTLDYMSPQQADGEKPAATDDIYSVGATLYELLTSTPPFYTGDIGYQVRHNRPQDLSERLLEIGLENDDIPSSVSALIMACLSKDPAQRPQSARLILDWLAGETSGRQRSNAAAPSAASGEQLRTADVSSSPAPVERTAAPPVADMAAPTAEPAQPSTAPESSAPDESDSASTNPDYPKTPTKKKFFFGFGIVMVSGAIAATWYWQPNSDASRAITAAAQTAPAETGAYQKLFNGRDLQGWDGDPSYWSVENETITGRVRADNSFSPRASFLIWRGGEVADFELRLKVKSPVKSGVSYRAREDRPWALSGYHLKTSRNAPGQFLFLTTLKTRELAMPGEQTIAGVTAEGEYVEKVGPTTDFVQVQRIYKPDDWNDCVLLARGNRFQHWINGVLFSDVTDQNSHSFMRSGLLGFEFSPQAGPGAVVQFKDIRLKHVQETAGGTDATQTDGGWITLFDGSSASAWRGYDQGGFPDSSWTVENGALKTIPGSRKVDLITQDRFGSFELELDWKVAPGANSGIFFRVKEGLKEAAKAAPEMQLLDDSAYPEGNNGKTQTGALYGVMPPGKRFLNPVGQYNNSVIIVRGERVQFWINGRRILEVDLADAAFRDAAAKRKWFDVAWATEKNGHVGLQHYGSEVWFRNIRVRRLD